MGPGIFESPRAENSKLSASHPTLTATSTSSSPPYCIPDILFLSWAKIENFTSVPWLLFSLSSLRSPARWSNSHTSTKMTVEIKIADFKGLHYTIYMELLRCVYDTNGQVIGYIQEKWDYKQISNLHRYKTTYKIRLEERKPWDAITTLHIPERLLKHAVNEIEMILPTQIKPSLGLNYICNEDYQLKKQKQKTVLSLNGVW